MAGPIKTRTINGRLFVEFDATPHTDLSLSLAARGLLLLMQLHPEVDWGGLPYSFLAKITGANESELCTIFEELWNLNLLPWVKHHVLD